MVRWIAWTLGLCLWTAAALAQPPTVSPDFPLPGAGAYGGGPVGAGVPGAGGGRVVAPQSRQPDTVRTWSPDTSPAHSPHSPNTAPTWTSATTVPSASGTPGGVEYIAPAARVNTDPVAPQPQPSYLDLDSYLGPQMATEGVSEEWTWQLLPSSLIYKSYLAGLKESRFASQHVNIDGLGWMWDAVLGTRVGLLRFGDHDPVRPNGFQIDAEGAAQVRLDVTDDVNVRSADFRGGLPLTYGVGRWRTKLAYYHLSSHLGDEFLLANPTYPRLNYSRDCLVLGETVFLTERLRIYAEMAWAFHNDVCKPWEFQFGLDYAPVAPTGFSGAPFFAINCHLRQELNYSGNLVVETGWAWVSDEDGRLLRLGLLYMNGLSSQYSFYQQFEQQIGAGVWYDF